MQAKQINFFIIINVNAGGKFRSGFGLRAQLVLGVVWITLELLERQKVKKCGMGRKAKEKVSFAGVSSAEVESEQHDSADEAIAYPRL